MKEVDLNKVMVWDGFVSEFIKRIEDSDPFEVDLSFEYKDRHGQTITYSSGDSIYIVDIKVSPNGLIMFEIPYGGESRFIPLTYADQISNGQTGLESLVEECYTKFYNSLEDKTGIEPDIFKFANSIYKDENLNKLCSILNNSTEYMQAIRQAEIDKKSFKEIDDFGLF